MLDRWMRWIITYQILGYQNYYILCLLRLFHLMEYYPSSSGLPREHHRVGVNIQYLVRQQHRHEEKALLQDHCLVLTVSPLTLRNVPS